MTYADAHTTYRFTELFLTAWAFWPATLLHFALTFPQRRGIVRRFPRVVWLPYLVSAVVAVMLQLPVVRSDVRLLLAVPAAGPRTGVWRWSSWCSRSRGRAWPGARP